MSVKPEVRILDTAADLFRAAAAEFAARATEAITSRGKFTVALSGGSTPKGLFSVLASDYANKIAWNKIHFFWGDERHVPPDSPDSNYRMANETLLSKVAVDPKNIFRVPAEGRDTSAVAREYEETIQRVFALKQGEFPRFDLILLGMGPDGHTASLFPGTQALAETQGVFVANWVEKLNAYRFTLTYPAIDNAAEVLFLVSGSDKASMLNEVLTEQANESKMDKHPAARVNPAHGKLLWMADQAADPRNVS